MIAVKILWVQALVLLLCVLYAGVAAAQGERKLYDLNENDSMRDVYTDGLQAFLNERLQQRFPSLGYRATINNITYDFDRTGRCRIIDFGFSDCPPCRVQLPYFIAMSNDERYAGIDFLYISFDDSATIMKDMTGLSNGPYDRLRIFSFDKAYFTYTDKPLLAYGCPAMYFIDSAGMVKAIINGGSAVSGKNTEQLLKTRWTNYIDSLLHN